MNRPALQNKQVVILRMALRARKVLGTFEKRGPEQGKRLLQIPLATETHMRLIVAERSENKGNPILFSESLRGFDFKYLSENVNIIANTKRKLVLVGKEISIVP